MSTFYSFPLHRVPRGLAPIESDSANDKPSAAPVSETVRKRAAADTTPNIDCDVLIAGSGPVGATYARAFLNAGLRVLMVDVGDQDTRDPGVHKKNTVGFQKNIDKFVHVIQGALDRVSIPSSDARVNTLDPLVWQADKPFTHNGINPEQDPSRNLGAQAVTRTVGGMSTHWTCATPRFKGEELPKLVEDDKENQRIWDELYDKAEALIKTGNTQFADSMRHQMVLKALKDAYGGSRVFNHLPLACERVSPSFVNWSSAATIFDLKNANVTVGDRNGWFRLKPTHQCYKLYYNETSITQAKIRSFDPNATAKPKGGDSRPWYTVTAKVYILAAGAVANPQILVQSKLVPYGNPKDPGDNMVGAPIKNVGRYITEQTMAFCQTVFYKSVIEAAEQNPDFKERIENHRKRHPQDPLPIPWTDPEPQIISLYDDTTGPNGQKARRPWHGQIHRDAFSYGAVAESIDNRLIVDFRWFGRTEPSKDNVLFFPSKYTDNFDMPQPTFDYAVPPGRTREEANRMMSDMIDVASKIGGFLPGSNPQFMEPGLALHLGGTHRSGLDESDSVVDSNSKVWNFENLYLGGVGNIPTAFAQNPTLTAIGYAIRSSEFILKDTFGISTPTWDLDKADSASKPSFSHETLEWEKKPEYQ